MPDARSWLRLRNAAWIAFVVHIFAGLAMATILRFGLDTNSDLDARFRFLAEMTLWWDLSWLLWSGAALSILWFYLAFALAHWNQAQPRAALWFAVLLATSGIALDLGAEAMEMGAAPELARAALAEGEGPARDLYLATHRTAMMLTGYGANGLYSLAALLLAWTTRGAYRIWEWPAGLVVGVGGLGLSAAVLVNWVDGMVAANLVLGPFLPYWLAVVGLAAGRKTTLAEARGQTP